MKKITYLFLVIVIVACSGDDSSDTSNDTIAPIITLLGEANVSIVQNTNYIDAGATAIDNVDGDLTSNIVATGSVNSAVIGSYTITYSVSDAAGNTASVSRQVTVTDNPVYLDANGITIKAREWAEVGAMGDINGVTYTVVDNSMLRDMAQNGDDVTKLATTKVTEMHDLFWTRLFNQDIGNWDVSNVTTMILMFSESSFNQDISNWDVSNVTNMEGMFLSDYAFNQDIANWDVSNVTDMPEMFKHAHGFNQDLSSWNVDGVFNCFNFSYHNLRWILPKPNFINCNP